MVVLRQSLDEAHDRFREVKSELQVVRKENEQLKTERQMVESSVSERSKADSDRSEKELRRLRRKVDEYEVQLAENERLRERLSSLDADARGRQDAIVALEAKLATQTEQLRHAEQDLTRVSSSSKTSDEERKVFFFPLCCLAFLFVLAECETDGMICVA